MKIMTSMELEKQKNTFSSEVDKIINEFKSASETIVSVSGTFERSSDTVLNSIASDNNKQLIKLLNDFASKASSLKKSIVFKTNDEITRLKTEEAKAREKEKEKEKETEQPVMKE